MRRILVVVLVCTLFALPALGDDQAKAQKQLNLITAMATDLTAHRVVSITISDYLKVKRSDLVKQRLHNNLNYGSLFLARQLMTGNATEQELTSALNSGKSIFVIANERHVDWKQVLNEAKKLNGKINRHLYEHFFDARDDHQRDLDDHYEVLKDSTTADDSASADDIATVADAYNRARDLALQRPGRHNEPSLDPVDSLQFRRDHARESAPTPGDTGMNTTPR